METSTRHDPALDGLRAIAAFAVVAFHLSMVSLAINDTTESYAFYARHLDVGVELFFVLSGYLMFAPFARANLGTSPRPAIAEYFVRRFARIFPAWWAYLAVASIFGWVDDTRFGVAAATPTSSLLDFLRWATLTHTWFGPVVHISWTLAIEVAFYCFVPAFAALVVRSGCRGVLGHVGAIGVLIALGVVANWAITGPDVWPPLRVLPRALPALGMGMLFAVVNVARTRHPVVERRVRSWFRMPVLWWCLAAILFFGLGRVVVQTPLTWPALLLGSRTDHFAQEMVQTLIASLVVAAVVFGPRLSWELRMLSLRPLVWVGVVSYALYLWHVDVFRRFAWNDSRALDAWLTAMPAVGAAVVVGVASWFIIERPAQRFARRFGGAR